MLKLLLRSRLQVLLSVITGSTRTKKAKTTGQLAGFAALMLLSAASMGFYFWHIFDALAEPLHMSGMDWLYFAMAAAICFGLMLIGNLFAAKAQLYEARDNELLLSLPIRPSHILISRLFLLWVLALAVALLVGIPAWLSSAILLRGWRLAAFLVVFLVILPLLNVALSSFLGWLLHLAAIRARNKSLVTILLWLVFLGGYTYLNFRMNNLLAALAQSPDKLAGVLGAAAPLVWIGRAIADGKPLYLLYLLFPTLVIMALCFVLLSRSFIRTATDRRDTAKRRYVERTEKALSPDAALLQRELRRLWASPAYLFNSGLGFVFVLLGVCALLLKRRDLLAIPQYPQLAPLLRLAFLMGLCLMAIYVFLTAPSISLEGKSLWVVRSLPVDSFAVLRAKLRMDLLFGLPPLLLAALVLALGFDYRGTELLFLFTLPPAYCVFVGLLGLFENLRHPNFNWTNETQAVKSGVSVLFTMLIGMGSVLVPVLAYMLGSETLSVELLGFLTLGLLVALSLLLWCWLREKGVAIFEKL